MLGLGFMRGDNMRAAALLAVAVLSFAPAMTRAQAPPATGPAENPGLARTFYEAGLDLLSKGDHAKAAAPLRRAIQNDTTLTEAHYHLAKAYQKMGQSRRAAEAYRQFVKLILLRTDLDAATRKLKTDAERQLSRLDVFQQEYAIVCADFAKRLRGLAAKHGGKPSCLLALEAAVAITPGDEHAKHELEAAKKLMSSLLPAAAEEGDPEGAQLLIARAVNLVKAGKKDEAAKILASACALARDAATLTAAAEGYLAIGREAQAAGMVTEALAAVEEADEKVRPALRGRLLMLPRKADPGTDKVKLLLVGFAVRAERVAARAYAGKDHDTAQAILTVVVKLVPDRSSAWKLLARLTDTPPSTTRLPNLTATGVKCIIREGVNVRVTRHAVEVTGVTKKVRPGGTADVGVVLGFEPLAWGKRMRATWRVQQLKPTPDAPTTTLWVSFWPAASNMTCFFSYPAKAQASVHSFHGDKKNYKSTQSCDEETQKQAFRKDGTYELTFEKKGPLCTLVVDGRELGRFEWKDERQAAKAPVQFRMYVQGEKGDENVAVHFKATLLDFSCSPDCIK